jgi:hypothetical protein
MYNVLTGSVSHPLVPEMSIATENLLLLRRGDKKEKLTRRCRDDFQENVLNFAAVTVRLELLLLIDEIR